MAQFFTNFSEYTAGAGTPTGWTRRWVTSNVTDSILADGGYTGGKALQIEQSGNARRLITWDDIPDDDNVEIVFRWKRLDGIATNSIAIGPAGRASGSASSETAYAATTLVVASNNEHFSLRRYLSGVFSSALDAEEAVTPAIDTWHYQRLRLNGTSIEGWYWTDPDEQGDGWSLSATDSDITADGWVGILTFGSASSGTTRYIIDWIGVGTVGDAAPTQYPPTITTAPSVSYGSWTRTGPQNTPAVVSFTVTDQDDTGAGELNWGIYTATAGGGTEVASGTCTSGVQEQVNIAYNASGLSEGSNTLYLLVDDGTYDDEESFTLSVDTTAPVTFTPTADPGTVSVRIYAVELTAEDATSTGTNELTYEVRTAASGAGTLLTSGYRTSSGTAFTTPDFNDPLLEDGSNTRYVRVIDGAGNVREVSFTVTGVDLPVQVVTDTPYARPRPQARDLITVEIYRPLGQHINGTRAQVDRLDINPNVTALTFGSVLPGGWSAASVGIANPNHNDRYGEPPRRPWLPREMVYGPFYHVEIKRHGRVLFAGRMGPVQRSRGIVTGFSAQGYGMAATYDMYYRNTSTTVVSSGTLLREMLAATAPHLVAAPPGEMWQDPGVAHAYDEFHRMYIGDVLDQIASEGDSAGNLVDWMVYEDQVVQLKTRHEPVTPNYLVPVSMVTDYVEDTSGMIGTATYERSDDGTTTGTSTDYIDADFASEHGFQRGEVVQLGEISAAAAAAMTKTYLRLNAKPVISAAIEAGPDDRLEAPGGRLMPRDEVRAGEWVAIEGVDTPLVIVSADYDAFTDVVRIQAGEFVPDFAMLLATLEQDRRKRQRQIIPRYSGRAR